MKIPTGKRNPIMDRFDHGRRAVSDDFAHGVTDLRAIVAHHQDGVGAHRGCVLDKPVQGVAARLLEQLGIFVNFAADDGPQPGDQIAAQPSAAHDHPETLSERLNGAMSGDIFGRDDDHGDAPEVFSDNPGRFQRDCQAEPPRRAGGHRVPRPKLHSGAISPASNGDCRDFAVFVFEKERCGL